MPHQPLHIAIIGGGLCGISLGIALKTRSIPFTLYESRNSFTEIGAGINFGPSALRSLHLINPSLGAKVYGLATRNPAPDEEVWMDIRYGAEWEGHEDGEVLEVLRAPPTGNITVHRQELLEVLAEEMGVGNVRFVKKFVGYRQDVEGLRIEFADGSLESASVVIGCDGIHSKVRAAMFGSGSVVAKPGYNYTGCYRAVVPIEKAVEAIGEDARRSQVVLGPRGYVIMYPVSGGRFVNCGAWPGEKEEDWEGEEWVKNHQHDQFVEDFKDWGNRIKKILDLFSKDVQFWASFQHIHQPERFQDGRVLLIGDGAHAMTPHQGAGAAQAVEDAYVLAEVLAELNKAPSGKVAVEAALQAVDEVRKPRFSKVQRYSSEAGPRWHNFFNSKLEGDDLEEWKRVTKERLEWIWGVDLVGEAEKAKAIMREMISKLPSV